MSSQKSLMSIILQGRDVFLFSEYEREKNLSLKILDIKENESYIGQASALDLRTQAARIRLTFKDYLDHAMKALFQSSQEEFTYVYSLEENDNIIFKWKSIDQDETVINLGSVPMKKQDYVIAFKESLLCLAKELQGLNSTIQKLNSDLVECKCQTSNALNLLSETIDAKESLEKEMYAKFSLVLNEKKKFIQRRKNGNASQSSHKINLSHNVTKTKCLKNIISDSSEEDVDEFIDQNKPGPSTSVKRNSLFDDDEDSVVPLKPSKMRNRKNVSKIKPLSPEHISDVKNDLRSEIMFDDDSDDLLSNL